MKKQLQELKKKVDEGGDNSPLLWFVAERMVSIDNKLSWLIGVIAGAALIAALVTVLT